MSVKKKVQVTIIKEIEIELTDSVFFGMSTEDYLKEFNSSLWSVKGIGDVIAYAAESAATGNEGFTLDGIGLLGRDNFKYSRKPDTKFKIVSQEIESEILDE